MASLETHRMKEIVKGLSTVSDQMRALNDAGFERADIARFLNKRYQHVRNVLVAARPKRQSASPNSTGVTSASGSPRLEPVATALTAKIQIGAGGRIVIPAEIRAALGVSEGDVLLARVKDGELRLLSRDAAVRKAQALVRKYVPAGTSLVDELIADRREEARRETEE